MATLMPKNGPLRYTPVRDPENDPMKSVSEFWDVPKFLETLSILQALCDRLIVW